MKLNVAVLFGGKTTEHEISIISALQAIENIDRDKYNVIPVYISKSGDFYYSKDNLLVDSSSFKNMPSLISKCEIVYFAKERNNTYIRSINDKLFARKLNQVIDVAFPIVHGTNVEDGNLQGFLHTLNLPIVGPDTLSSAICMDKYVMKEYASAINIPVVPAIRIDKNDYIAIDDTINNLEDKINYPMIVKPVNLGSSIGIEKAKDRERLKEALSTAFSFANVVLVEKAIVNMREINCAVLGDKFEAVTSALEEPFGNDEILSFRDKYMSGGKGSKGTKISGAKGSFESVGSKSGMASLKRKIPADIDKGMEEKIKTYALKIFKYIGCSGVARIDFIINKDNNEIYVNEINSIPGSLSYYLFEPIGIKFKELLDRLISIAIENYKMEDRLSFTFDTNILS